MTTRLAILTSLLITAAPLLGETVDQQLSVLISQEQIRQKVQQTARQIEAEYRDKDLCVVMVLKGALCLVADLIREIDLPLHVEVVQCSSYGARGAHRGELKVIGLDRLHVKDRDVLIVDDIFDSGHTMSALYKNIGELQPRSIKSCVLLEKNVPHITDIRPDYILFDIENLFVVGYGLDYKEQYRGLPGVYVLDPK